ncbi:hypothetical protein NBM05_14055 [Rothia sp. AR01]|uniref:Uncharacterized protein n=1 Tax=Rothia santali TaxID=2949643 RepID=A0A9X2KJD2_9MICC|nr:hypothetical protein [Rothia santali]MCP3427103.1 hypothetical protein [Rothia santali]
MGVRAAWCVLLTGALLGTSATVVLGEVAHREARDRGAGQRVGEAFAWPDHPALSDPGETLAVLEEAATETGTTVIRSVGGDAVGRPTVGHFVFPGSGETRLFAEYSLASGRWPAAGELRAATALATTDAAERPDGVVTTGVPRVLAHRYELTVAPLALAFDRVPTAGLYTLEAPDRDRRDRFLERILAHMVQAGATEVVRADLEGPPPAGGHEEGRVLASGAVPWLLGAVAVLVALAMLVRDARTVGVLRLLGYSRRLVWYRVVGRWALLAAVLGSAGGGAIAVLLPGADADLLLRTLAASGAAAGAVVLSTALGGILVIQRIHAAELMKGGLR